MKYPKDESWSEIVPYTLHAKRFEPVSVKGAVVRNNVGHRFEINTPGAKSAMQVLAENVTANNALMSRLISKSKEIK